jgi:hypothetical protein
MGEEFGGGEARIWTKRKKRTEIQVEEELSDEIKLIRE